MRQDLRESFAAFVTGELHALRRLAYALSGDGAHADDLVQGALERMYLAWPRAHRASNPGAYLRTVLFRLAISESRRPFRRREVQMKTVPATKHQRVADASGSIADRLDLAEALNVLTPKQRAIVALRYLEDRAVAEVAEILGISAGTVKRQSHDAMAMLRRHLCTSHDGDGAAQPAPLEERGAR